MQRCIHALKELMNAKPMYELSSTVRVVNHCQCFTVSFPLLDLLVLTNLLRMDRRELHPVLLPLFENQTRFFGWNRAQFATTELFSPTK